MNKKMIGMIMGVFIMGTLIMGCNAKQGEDGDTDTSQAKVNQNVQRESDDGEESDRDANEGDGEQNEEVGEHTVFGKVGSIDGNRITIQLGTMGGRRLNDANVSDNLEFPNDFNGQNRPDRPSSSDMPNPPDRSNEGTSPDRTPPPMPDGSNGRPSRGGAFETTDETKEIVIEDESVIRKRNGRETVEASLADIEEGVIISVTYNREDDETIESVTILTMWDAPAPGDDTQSES